MWPFRSSNSSAEHVQRRWRELQKSLVPPEGDADTWQGEIVRVIGNAEDEALRNGFINWDESDTLELTEIVERLCSGDTFDTKTQARIRSCAATIAAAGEDPEKPAPTTEDWAFMRLCAVEWCDAHPKAEPLRDEDDYVGHD